MSMINASSSLLIFLLYLCVHACYARNVPRGYNSSKDGQKPKLGDVSFIHHQGISKREAADNNSTSWLPLDQAISSKPEDQEIKKQQRSGETHNNAGAVPITSVGSVSWQVPPKKKHHQNPGFHSDYSRPSTRPPCHN